MHVAGEVFPRSSTHRDARLSPSHLSRPERMKGRVSGVAVQLRRSVASSLAISQLVLTSSSCFHFTRSPDCFRPSPSPLPLFRKIRLSKDLIPLFDVFPNFVRNMLCSENSKYRDLVYYFLVITPFCAVLGTNIVCDPDRLPIVFAFADC